ncbi:MULTISPECIES: ABC transporter substrate-binding protein [unclassified Helicobacter]|uniref:ABC transporter substrate-binding protein n=1 Tax=unclassified Helicobacter TaxID=2593540 RepID=UPI000CF0A852|nr:MULTISPECIES: ABC transporter substrate-binding protein [unclassified Helicobacter]
MQRLILFFGTILFCFGVEYEDFFGKHYLEKVPQRVVYLSTYIEMPAMLEIWDKVVGISSYAFDDDIVKQTAPLDKIQKFPTDHYAGIDIEKLKKMQVDLVITYPADLKSIEFAKKFGINFFAAKSKKIDEVLRDIQIQAKIFNKQEGMQVKISKMKEILELIEKRVPKQKKKKAIEIFHKINQVSGKESLDSDILSKGGVDNVGERYIKQGRGEINLENLIVENPDIIFLWWLSPYEVKDILSNPQLQTLKAVKNKQVFKLPAMDIAGPRIPLIALYIAMKSYPEMFLDIKYEDILQEYYKVIF